jgi:hypothetical protein
MSIAQNYVQGEVINAAATSATPPPGIPAEWGIAGVVLVKEAERRYGPMRITPELSISRSRQ